MVANQTSLSSKLSYSVIQEFTEIKKKSILYLLSLFDSQRGGFRFTLRQPVTLMATSYCVLGLEFLQGLTKLSDDQRECIISFLMSSVQADGSFQDSLFQSEDILSDDHDLSYFQEETTTMCQQALDALGAPPPPPRKWPTNWQNIEGMIDYFDSFPWENPWLDSNRVMFTLSQFCHDAERHQNSELLTLVDAALDWLDAHQSPTTGLWEGRHPVSLTNAMAATFHFTFYYGYRHRSMHYAERIIDSCLSLQNHYGLFSDNAIGQTCLDYDAIDLLAKASLVTDHRASDIQHSMMSAYEALQKLFNIDDGGFANCKQRFQPEGDKKRLLRKVLQRFRLSGLMPAPASTRARGTYSVCWRLLSCGTAKSNAFSTWFRLVSIFLTLQQQALDTDSKNIIEECTFRRLPFLGYHNLDV